jgi:membrane protease YdiL (CAAX protease family)
MALIYFVVLENAEGTANPALVTAYAVGKVIQFLFPLAYVWWFDRARLRIAPISFHTIPLALGFSLLVAASMFLLYYTVVKDIPTVAHDTPDKIENRLHQFGGCTHVGYFGMAIFFALFHSLAEEYYWRWFVYGTMRELIAVPAANVLSGLAFMAHHVVILGVFFAGNFWLLAVPFSLGVAVGGCVWAWFYERSGALYASWLSHCLVDAAIMGVGYAIVGARLQ